MGSDRARISYNDRQQYRAVIQQQGRVTLEADGNEAQQIASEELRKETLDFVGLAGTPDGGYAIILPGANLPNFDFAVAPGTMYVGGLRVELPPPGSADGSIRYFKQPDWLDPPAPQPSPPLRELIYLLLQEQEISATEDADLKDVALGGPDSAARLRLIQHIERRPTQATTCAGALDEVIAQWQAEGLAFDPQTMRLLPQASLKVKVGFQNLAGPPDLCEPAALEGYLGAENQLIRVKLTATDRLVWGFDNASFLYRVEALEPDNRTLTLRPRPVDAPHLPRKDQAVELLRAVAQLSNGEYVAAADGLVRTLSQAYDPDGQQMELLADLPPDYRPLAGTPRLFLRVWEEELTFAADTPVTLGDTGIEVTLQTAGGPFRAGDTWLFAARPSTPVQLYPRGYLTSFQPPAGPRQWVCPLAVIDWSSGQGEILEDCRVPFDNLVELTRRRAGCGCCITLGPEQVDGGAALQKEIDRQVELAKSGRVTISLKPGRYRLPETLRLDQRHAGLTLEGCDRGVILEAQDSRELAFLDGLIAVAACWNVTLRRLNFLMPRTSFFKAGGRLLGVESDVLSNIAELAGADRNMLAPFFEGLTASIGLRVTESGQVEVQACSFVLEGRELPTGFKVGVLLNGHCPGLHVEDNHFLARNQPAEALPLTFGLLHTPVIEAEVRFIDEETVEIRGSIHVPMLEGARICGNDFEGVGAAALIEAETGTVQIDDNRVLQVYAGFLLCSLEAPQPLDPDNVFDGSFLVNQVLLDPLIAIGTFLGRAYPPVAHFGAGGGSAVVKLAVPIPLPRGLAGGFVALNMTIVQALEQVVFRQLETTRRSDLIMCENTIQALPQVPGGEEDQPMSGMAILLWLQGPNESSVILSANRGLNRTGDDKLPAALILVAGSCSITGGLLHNLGGGPTLAVHSMLQHDDEAPVAITGNVFRGQRPLLPQRQGIPGPMNDWVFFNAWLPV
jgi:hypothetical protein